ncbi:prepilin peptidase [Nicoliella lavandulae]|uniref:prepilin peptidase n=1 Tax=Nicoliella lavandulae TaxID=3082954 RepID=UPI0035A104FF
MKIILYFIIGSTIGSFITLVIQRRDVNESIVMPRSHCNYCMTTLKWYDLVPVISYLLLNGRCRYCRSTISKSTIINEVIFGLLFMIIIFKPMNLFIFSSMLLMTLLAIIDYQKLMVPTIVIIVMFLNNLMYYFIFNDGNIIQLSLIIGTYLLTQLLNPFVLKMGAGDIDVIFILSLIIGFKINIILIIIAAVLALFFFALKRVNRIPFIPFLAISYLCCLLWI